MKERLLNIINQFENMNILIFGDIMFDYYLQGTADRISPEAPVPIIKKQSEFFCLGGAGNVAANVSALSGNSCVFAYIGKDEAGEKIIELAKKNRIDFNPLYCEKTIMKLRITASGQQVLRVDDENQMPEINPAAIPAEKIENSDLIIVSDYAKGAIKTGFMNYLREYSFEGKKIIIGAKPNPENLEKIISLYFGFPVIVLNKKEALLMSGEKDVNSAGRTLIDKFGSDIIITLAEKGMAIFGQNTKTIPTYAKEVYDVTGAGDTALASLGLALASGATLEEAAEIANHAAGVKVGKRGTYAVTKKELVESIRNHE